MPAAYIPEPFPNVLARYARRVRRAQHSLLELAHCSSAEMAARVARLLGFVISPDTLIRLQRRVQFPYPQLRVLGVDQFAPRRGRTYGTLLVDLERHRPISWRGPRPSLSPNGFCTIRRWRCWPETRPWGYALAGHTALPNAPQVADRFHLVYNVGNALKELFHSRR